jgi:hypothetical protein
VAWTRGFGFGAEEVRTAVGEALSEGFGVALSATSDSGLGVVTV